MLTGFLVLLWRGTRLAWLAPDDYSRPIALGVTVSIVLQALINLSVVLDLGPTKGIPLPAGNRFPNYVRRNDGV